MKRESPNQSNHSIEGTPDIFDDVSTKFSKGSIQCIKLRNFMTFEKITISPSPGLNVIIGPNGSGKSSIICAIALGLGGSPSVLARTNKLTGFIKHSCQEAKIKILLTDDPPLWVYRKISADNTNQWKIKTTNNKWKVTTTADVLQRVQKLHIQLDNLCMFLPQERVKEFSLLKPNQLLMATEQAINKKIFNAHQSLLKDFQGLKDSSQKINDMQNNLQIYKSEVERMRTDVQRYRQVQECKENIEKYEKKIPWVVYQKIRAELSDLKKKLHKEIVVYKKTQEELAPLYEEIEKLKSQKGDSTKLFSKFKEIKSEIMELTENIFKNESKIQGAKSKIDIYSSEREAKEKKIEQLQIVLEQKSQTQVDEFSKTQLNQKKSELQKLHHQIQIKDGEFRHQISEIELKAQKRKRKLNELNQRIQQFKNQKSRLIEHLRNNLHFNSEVELYYYIEEHKNQLVNNVYGPICIELLFKNPNDANIIQMVVENRHLLSFLAEDNRDFNTLFKYIKDNNIRGVSITSAETETKKEKKPCPNLTDSGFDKYAISLFQAPEPVKKLLCEISSLDRIPIGTGEKARRSIKNLQSDVFPQNGINRYFIDNIFYIMYKSRQGNSNTIVSTPIRKSNIWREIINQDDDLKDLVAKSDILKEKINKSNEEIQAIHENEKNVKNELADVTKQIQEVKRALQEQFTLEDKLQRIKNKISQIQKELSEDPKKIKEYKDKYASFITAKTKLCIKIGNSLKRIIKSTKEVDKALLSEQQINSKLIDLQDQLEEENQKYSEMEKHILELNQEKEQLTKELKAKEAEAKEICPPTEENKHMMQSLPSDLEILKSDLARLKARYSSLAYIDPSIASRFSKAENKRDEVQAKLDELISQTETTKKEVEEKFNEWKQRVSTDVSKINQSFSELMSSCKYRGKVELDSDDKEKLETYRLNLMVGFNENGKLAGLSSSRQSGGEKSVTTLMYLLALQDCTKFPFRVVDEINQGMDEINDRNTFSQVMSYAIKKNQSSQYFLVTPKLLPSLDLMEGVTVLVVMNGPFVDQELSTPITFNS